MRKIYLFMNVSLDGYFEAPGHDISGFKNDPEASTLGKGGKVDTLLFGHRTYEMMKFWSTPQARETMPEIANFMEENQKVVVSHLPFEPGWSKVTVVSSDPIATIRQLKQQPGDNIIIFGSNNLCVSLMQAGLIDEFQIVVNPVTFGAGTPLFTGLPVKFDLVLKDIHRFKSGAVLLIYAPAP